MKTTTFENAKVGDKVWSVQYGWVYIDYVGDSSYPIKVKLNSGLTTYFTLCGRQSEGDVSQTLFWDEVVIEAPAKPMPVLQVDAKVLVWKDDSVNRYCRHFSHFENNNIYVFDKGLSSWTGYTASAWDHFEVAE